VTYVTLNDVLKEVSNEAAFRNSTGETNPKLFATSFFLIGLGLGSLENYGNLKFVIESLKEIEQQEKIRPVTVPEKFKARMEFLETMKSV
jgi:hypothetical protein